jgi:cytidine deaminase
VAGVRPGRVFRPAAMEMETKMKTSVANEIAIFRAIKSTTVSTAPSVTVSICGWCPDVRQRTLELVNQGKLVSHGMCPACQAKMEKQMVEGR